MPQRLVTTRTFVATLTMLAFACSIVGCTTSTNLPTASPRAEEPGAVAALEPLPQEAVKTVVWETGYPFCPYCRQRTALESTACAKCSHDFIWQAEYGPVATPEKLKERFMGTWGTAWAYGGVGNSIKPPGIQITLERDGTVWDDGVDASMGTWRVIDDGTIEIDAQTTRWPVNPLRCTLRGGLLYPNSDNIDHFARQ